MSIELQELLGVPLLQACEEDSSREAVEFEAGLALRPGSMPEGLPDRPSYLRFLDVPPETTLVRQGDLETELLIVLAGRLRAELTEPGRGRAALFELGPGEWLGETTALSQLPAPVSLVSISGCRLAAMDARLFRKLYAEDEGFKAAVDEVYRRRSLELHLRSAPLFAGASASELRELAAAATLVSLEPGEELCAAGAKADGFYLVRSGGIECIDGDGRVLAYYMANSSFGEHAVITDEAAWPATCRALDRTELVRLPRKFFRAILARDPGRHRAYTRRANRLVGLAEPPPDAADDEVHVMVQRRSFKGGRALVIDRSRCIRCNVCVESCVDAHDDRIPRISKIGTRLASGNVLITSCYNCATPGCMLACNYGAIRRDRQGLVRFEFANCVGCAACIDGCPYGVIRMTAPRVADDREPPSAFAWLKALFGFGSPSPPPPETPAPAKVMNIGGEEVEVQGKAIKCDLCVGLPFEACVYNCPTSAIERCAPEALFG